MTLASSTYVLLASIGGVVVMTHKTLQSQYALKDIAPRLAFAVLASNRSLQFTGWGIELANALSGASLNQRRDPAWMARMLERYLLAPLEAPAWCC